MERHRPAEGYVGAEEAAKLLGVTRETLYAYVSRGRVRSVADPAGRGSLYLRGDLERWRARSLARSGHGPNAAGALRWGEPVLDSALTELGPEGPRYRGHLATALAGRVGLESVAELLWTGSLPATAPRWPRAPRAPTARLIALLPAPATPLAAATLAITALGVRDPARFAATPEVERARGRTLLRELASMLGAVRGAEVVDAAARAQTIAETVAIALGARHPKTAATALDETLVLCADHELNVSTFAARIAASAGADLHACIAAALAALSGPRHGGACDRVEALVAEVGSPARARAVIHERTRRGETIPGFGHRLYPLHDPRTEPMLARARALGHRRSPALQTLLAIVRVMADERREPPTLDAGLVAIASALGLPAGAAVSIFAVGRAAGWIAHVLEQREDGQLLRPRARYVGVQRMEDGEATGHRVDRS